jgi:hypothetical protein
MSGSACFHESGSDPVADKTTDDTADAAEHGAKKDFFRSSLFSPVNRGDGTSNLPAQISDRLT